MTTPTRDTPRDVLWWMLWDNYTPAEKVATIDAYRLEILAAEATTIRNLPIPAEAGPHWHWYSLALNRAADHISRQGGTP